MKRKTVVACALAACAASAPSWGTQPTGPQGTAWFGYGPATFDDLDRNHDGVITRDEYRVFGLGATRSRAYSGFSADTNPPAPAP